MECMMNIGLLPEIIILEIFRHLPYSDLCKAAQVCTLWQNLSRESGRLRKVIDVRKRSLTPESIEEFVVHHCSDKLVDLKLKLVEEYDAEIELQCTNITPHCLKLLEDYAPNLKCLTLEKSQQTVNREERVSLIASLPKSITHFSVAGSAFVDSHESDLNLKSSNVVCLDLRNCFFCQDGARFCIDVPNLKDSLYLEEVFFHKRGVRVDLFRPAFPQLKILDLESTWLLDEQLRLVFENCYVLEELFIGNNENVTNQMLQRIGSGLLPMLHTMCVINTSVTLDVEHVLRLKLKKLRNFNCSKQETPCHHYLNHKCPIFF